jgi:hypothetical protein
MGEETAADHGALAEAIRLSTIDDNSPAGPRLDFDAFKRIYYVKYYFLFRKNLSNTDIPFGELLALLRIHISQPDSGSLPLEFDTSKSLSRSVNQLWSAMPAKPGIPLADKAQAFVAEFNDLLTFSVAVDALYGSCVVHVPRGLSIDISRIVSESGYIYAAGRAIYVRRTKKASKSLFRENLISYLRDHPPSTGKKIAFLIHSPQLFPINLFNREVASQLRHGLDDVKISLDKFYFEDRPLFDFRAELSSDEELARYLAFVDTEHGRYDSADEQTEDCRSIWMIAERQVESSGPQRAPDRYFACYVQEYVNRNQLHLFNERKPGWLSPITLPHTLAAAMINLARPYLNSTKSSLDNVAVFDPFAGTGTLLFEFAKFDAQTSVTLNDINPTYRQVVADNARFFSLGQSDLLTLQTLIGEVVEVLHRTPPSQLFTPDLTPVARDASPPARYLHSALRGYIHEVEHFAEMQAGAAGELRYEYAKGLNSHLFSPRGTEVLREWSYEQRIIFYLVWRALVRNTFSLLRNPDQAAVAKEVLIEELGLVKYELKTLLRDLGGVESDSLGLRTAQGRYSQSSIVGPGSFSQILDADRKAGVRAEWIAEDAGDLIRRLEGEGRRYDLIITDPPYGINALEGPQGAEALVRLYATFIRGSVRLLGSGGQLLLCIPENTHNGQIIPMYMTREVIVREVLISAQQAGLHVVNPSLDYPFPDWAFKPPFYWESERTLRRSVLHFVLTKAS